MNKFNTRPLLLGSVIGIILSLGLNFAHAQEEEFVFDDAPSLDGWSTGPEVGATLPDVVGMDQHGNARSFDEMKGPNGAYIVFHRSADW